MSKNSPEIHVGPRKVIRVNGKMGPCWAVYSPKSTEAEFFGSEANAVNVARSLNEQEIRVKSKKAGLDVRTIKAFYDVGHE